MRLYVTLALFLALILAVPAHGQDKLVVHEWGTFTNFAGSDGIHLEFRPLIGEDLPSFVYTSAKPGTGLRSGPACGCGSCSANCGCGNGKRGAGCGCKLCSRSRVRMETPVLYFYADREQVVSVKVGFPQGKITEWYPQARAVDKGIDWGKIRIMPRAKPRYPNDNRKSHYYPARETDASPIRVCGGYGNQFEKFLFYRGVGNFSLPLKLTALGNDQFRLDNTGKQPIRSLFLVRIKGGKIWFSAYDQVKQTRQLQLSAEPSTTEALSAQLIHALVKGGLYQKEAQAMLKTWRTSWFTEEGTRLLYLVPEELTEKILPLEIKPAPQALVRILVGRLEILTPEQEATIARLVRGLGANAFKTRELATASLIELGRFAEPALQRVLATSRDLEVRTRARKLLGLLGFGK